MALMAGSSMGSIGRACCAGLITFCAVSAEAHRLSPGYFGLTEVAPNEYQAQWKVSISGGLAETLTPIMPEGCAVAGSVRVYVLDDRQTPNDIRLQHADVTCEQALAGGSFTVAGLESTQTDVLLRIDYADGSSFTHRLVPERPSVVIPERPGTVDVIRTYTGLGMEHILAGVDHLLFVLALLLLVVGWGRLVATITAFTVAHSVTLAAATLGFVSVSPAAVEATIALSILFLATELAGRLPLAGRGTEPGRPAGGLATRLPWVVAFSFGLLHGFGFAGALEEIGLPEQAIPLALLFFNVGVELGQLSFIAVVIAAAWVLGRMVKGFDGLSSRLAVIGRGVAAYVIGSVSAFWVFERTWSAIQPVAG